MKEAHDLTTANNVSFPVLWKRVIEAKEKAPLKPFSQRIIELFKRKEIMK